MSFLPSAVKSSCDSPCNSRNSMSSGSSGKLPLTPPLPREMSSYGEKVSFTLTSPAGFPLDHIGAPITECANSGTLGTKTSSSGILDTVWGILQILHEEWYKLAGCCSTWLHHHHIPVIFWLSKFHNSACSSNWQSYISWYIGFY